jgi:hypothetical protein
MRLNRFTIYRTTALSAFKSIVNGERHSAATVWKPMLTTPYKIFLNGRETEDSAIMTGLADSENGLYIPIKYSGLKAVRDDGLKRVYVFD